MGRWWEGGLLVWKGGEMGRWWEGGLLVWKGGEMGRWWEGGLLVWKGGEMGRWWEGGLLVWKGGEIGRWWERSIRNLCIHVEGVVMWGVKEGFGLPDKGVVGVAGLGVEGGLSLKGLEAGGGGAVGPS